MASFEALNFHGARGSPTFFLDYSPRSLPNVPTLYQITLHCEFMYAVHNDDIYRLDCVLTFMEQCWVGNKINRTVFVTQYFFVTYTRAQIHWQKYILILNI